MSICRPPVLCLCRKTVFPWSLPLQSAATISPISRPRPRPQSLLNMFTEDQKIQSYNICWWISTILKNHNNQILNIQHGFEQCWHFILLFIYAVFTDACYKWYLNCVRNNRKMFKSSWINISFLEPFCFPRRKCSCRESGPASPAQSPCVAAPGRAALSQPGGVSWGRAGRAGR